MAIVCNELLGRPLLKIYQDTEAFNFSIDTMILADFVTIGRKVTKICDLCCGTAPIPLYLTLRSKAHILGVEIQKESYDLALESININNLNDQIEVVNDNLININEKIGKECFDVVTCNPPFFKVGNHHINPSDRKAIARHEIMATLDDIVKEASMLLVNRGKFALVHRPERLEEIFRCLKKYNLEPKRLRLVYPHIGSECNHVLIEAIKNGNPGNLRILSPLIVYDENNKWTKEVIKIYNYDKEE